VLEIVEAEAYDLARPGHRQRIFQARERPPGGSRCALGDVAKGLEIAIVARQYDGEIIGHGWIYRLEIDDLSIRDDPEPHPRIRCKPDDFHEAHPVNALPNKPALVDHFAQSSKSMRRNGGDGRRKASIEPLNVGSVVRPGCLTGWSLAVTIQVDLRAGS
jgi:hypothetical protein